VVTLLANAVFSSIPPTNEVDISGNAASNRGILSPTFGKRGPLWQTRVKLLHNQS